MSKITMREQLSSEIISELLKVIKANNISIEYALKTKINALAILFEED